MRLAMLVLPDTRINDASGFVRRAFIRRSAIVIFAGVMLLASDARADLILLEDSLTFSYDVTAQPLLYGVDDEGNPGELLGPGATEHFAASFHGSTFGVDGHSWQEEIISAPRTDAYSGSRFSQTVFARTEVIDSAGSDYVSYMAGNSQTHPPGDDNGRYNYQPIADLGVSWKFIVDTDVNLHLAALFEEGPVDAGFTLTNLTVGTSLSRSLSSSGFGVASEQVMLHPGYVYSLEALIHSTQGGDGSVASFVVSADTDFVPAPVPEPMTMTLMGTGIAGLVVRRWRQRRKV